MTGAGTRARRLARLMDEAGLDVLVATSAENVLYLTGISSVGGQNHPYASRALAVVTRERPDAPYFASSRGDVDQFLDATTALSGVVAYGAFHRVLPEGLELSAREERFKQIGVDAAPAPDALAALVRILTEAGAAGARIGVDENAAPPGFLERLAEALPGSAVRPAAAVLQQVRKVKSEAELHRIAKAAALAEDGIRAALGIAAQGVTEQDMVREFETTVARGGGRSRFTLIKFGRDGVLGQTRPSDRPLRRGESVWFDVGCTYQGYWSDIARTASFGEPSARLSAVYAAMLAGEQAALEAAKPGMTGGELFDRTVEAVRAAGVPHYRRHHVGHGIGAEIYEPVLITPGNADVIEDGTVVNSETPYYEFGLGGVHVEDPFVVTEDGNRLLTTLGRSLIVID
ncbi:Xaa-Pro peptidase family protein [Streptomyces sp. NPDC049915]|uniref:Xaa-Pro peptidase family protein n=1 Tax=Streptomyces sp. NPDC049915 TaxID=3155510 RepID=UPI00341C060D